MNYNFDLDNKTITVWNGYIPLKIKARNNEELFKVENFVRNIKEDINLDYLLKLLKLKSETVSPEIMEKIGRHTTNKVYLANRIFKTLLDNELYLAVGKLFLIGYELGIEQAKKEQRMLKLLNKAKIPPNIKPRDNARLIMSDNLNWTTLRAITN